MSDLGPAPLGATGTCPVCYHHAPTELRPKAADETLAPDKVSRLNLVGALSCLRDLWRTVGNRKEAVATREAASREAERIEKDITASFTSLLAECTALRAEREALLGRVEALQKQNQGKTENDQRQEPEPVIQPPVRE